MDEQRRPLPARARRTSLVVVVAAPVATFAVVLVASCLAMLVPTRRVIAFTLRKISRVVGAR